MDTIIQVKDLTFRYHYQLVLEQISFSIHSGDFLAIIGPNGSGKSTLLKCLLGLLKPEQGNILWRDPKIRLGYVSQKATQSGGFPATVREVVASGLTGKLPLFRWMTKKDESRVEQALVNVGLSDFRERNIEKLSGGQKQRAFIARSLVSDPHILILDEPTVGIDLSAKEHFYQLLTHLHRKGLTIILVTHDLEMVPKIADRMICLYRKIIFEGPTAKFLQEENQILSRLYRIR